MADSAATTETATSAREYYDQGVRFAALKKHADAAEAFSQCLEALREAAKPTDSDKKADTDGAAAEDEEGEDDPALAPVLHKYGRELLSHAIITTHALGGGAGGAGGKGGASSLPSKVNLPSASAAGESDAAGASSSNGAAANGGQQKKLISFSGDTEEYDAADDEEEDDDDGNGEADEDDMDTAFAALDVARRLYERALALGEPLKIMDGSSLQPIQISRQLANVLTDLGELQLETENFIEAAQNFQATLDVLEPITDPLAFSRRLAEAHFQLALALEYHPEDSPRSRAPEHIAITQQLLSERRTALVQRRDSGEPPLPIDNGGAGADTDAAEDKGKGKASAVSGADVKLAEDDVRVQTQEQAAREITEVDELLKDLESKMEDVETIRNAAATAKPAHDVLRQAIDEAFHGAPTESNPFSGASAASSAPARNVNTLVKKKKKPAAEAPADDAGAETGGSSNGKRKAEDNEGHGGEGSGTAAEGADSGAKKARVESAAPGEE
ncbi:hypothetical protein V8E36_005897 [Tilletia maclaganii]